MEILRYDQNNKPGKEKKSAMVAFLAKHLEQFGEQSLRY